MRVFPCAVMSGTHDMIFAEVVNAGIPERRRGCCGCWSSFAYETAGACSADAPPDFLPARPLFGKQPPNKTTSNRRRELELF